MPRWSSVAGAVISPYVTNLRIKRNRHGVSNYLYDHWLYTKEHTLGRKTVCTFFVELQLFELSQFLAAADKASTKRTDEYMHRGIAFIQT